MENKSMENKKYQWDVVTFCGECEKGFAENPDKAFKDAKKCPTYPHDWVKSITIWDEKGGPERIYVRKNYDRKFRRAVVDF